jgi:hypothetical protein
MEKTIDNTDTYFNDLGTLKLELREDGFAAYLTISQTGKPIDETEIIDLLKSAAVNYGFENVPYSEKQYSKPFLIACGKKPKPKINLTFLNDKSKFIQEKYTVESLQDCVYVKTGQAIARLTSDQPEIVWIDVHGNQKEPQISLSAEIKKLLGNHVYWDSLTHEIKAVTNGYPFLDGENRISLIKEITVSEDLFNTALIIHCNLNLSGNVKNSFVFADGDIKFLGELKENNIVFSAKSIVLSNAEKSTIVGWGNLKLQGTLKNCHTFVNQHILGTRSSKIEGGKTFAGESVIVSQAGSNEKIQTDIEISYLPGYKVLVTNVFLKENLLSKIFYFLQMEQNDLREVYKKETICLIKKKKNRNASIKIYSNVLPTLYLRVLEKEKKVIKPEQTISLS